MGLNFHIPRLKHTGNGRFFLIAGPCAVEGEEMAFRIAETLVKIADKHRIPLIFKGSYRKANRTRLDSFTGIGDLKALDILQRIGKTFDVPVLTDIHSPAEAEMAAQYVDVLQIPAFLVRQTDLVVAAARTGKPVNLKKAQFMAPDAMRFAVEKVTRQGNDKVMLTERGSMFGYTDLVVDMRGLPVMRRFAPVVLDITHSLQQPNQSSGVTGGRPELIETIARAGVAAGLDGIFLETHYNPAEARSDAANMLPLDRLEPLLVKLIALHETVQGFA
ncbi:MAG: 3-deoxy-8-phosphooctulonate synthase [Chlorobi bacterium]|nr:3-deoxy-8-phosphooctulonate synthase [Chlorobiota bacterium]